VIGNRQRFPCRCELSRGLWGRPDQFSYAQSGPLVQLPAAYSHTRGGKPPVTGDWQLATGS